MGAAGEIPQSLPSRLVSESMTKNDPPPGTEKRRSQAGWVTGIGAVLSEESGSAGPAEYR